MNLLSYYKYTKMSKIILKEKIKKELNWVILKRVIRSLSRLVIY